MATTPLYLYLAINRGKTVTTKIGCTSDVTERLALLNALTTAPGRERRSRHEPGKWAMLLVIVVPRVLSAGAIKLQWARDKRKPHCRFVYGIKHVAWHYGLPYFINFAELHASTALCAAIPELVARLQPRGAVSASLAADLVSGRYPVATTRFASQSFARLDRPRDRCAKPAPGTLPARPPSQLSPGGDNQLHALVAQVVASMQSTPSTGE